jgi:hypothetical protein
MNIPSLCQKDHYFKENKFSPLQHMTIYDFCCIYLGCIGPYVLLMFGSKIFTRAYCHILQL